MNGFLKDITYARSGEYILSIYTRESCKDLWKNFGERPITFTITKKADPRGLRANSYAWALIEQLAARLKTDKESVYEEMIRRYGVGESYIDEAGNECKVLFSLRDGVPPRLVARHYAEIGVGYIEGKKFIHYCNSINPRLCAQLLGMRLSPDDENEDFCDMGFVRSAAEAQPEKLIFCCCYSALDDEDMSYYRRVWNMNHYEYELCENSDLDHIYEILETLGYEKSDDEEEMAEGTHRLFTIYGAAEDSDDDREETE